MSLLSAILPTVLPMVKQNLHKLEPAVIEYFAKYPLQPGEKAITAMLDIEKNKASILIVAIDETARVVRVIESDRLSTFIEKMLKQL